jgi:hypothetical protein
MLFFILVISLVVGIWSLGKRIWLLISLQLFGWFFILYTLLDWMPNYRFHVHSLPVLFTVVALGLAELVCRIGQNKAVFGHGGAIVIFFLLAGYIEPNIAIDKEMGYYEGFIPAKKPEDRSNKPEDHSKKPENWIFEVPGKIQTGVWPDLVREAMFLIENAGQDMTVGLRDIGFPGFISNMRVYDQIRLIDSEARNWRAALESKKGKIIRAYVQNGLRQNLINYNPDFYLFPMPKNKWPLVHNIYLRYFEKHMDQVKTLEYGAESIVYYRKKGLTRRYSNQELVDKYEKIVQEYPSYPAFGDRLKELYQ